MNTTIPIRQVPGKAKPWMIDLRSTGGGREFYATEGEARQVRKEKLAELKNFGTAATSLTPAERTELVMLRERMAQLGGTIQQAIELYAASRKPRESKTIADALAQMLSEKTKAQRRLKYVRQIGYDVRGFAAAIGSDTLTRDVTAGQINAWLHGNGWQPKTIAGKIISLQTFFAWCARRGWCDNNPTDAVERVQVDYSKPGILTPEQCARLMKAAQNHTDARARSLLPYLALSLFAGVRPEEVRRLSWKTIRNGELYIESAASKVRHHRVVTLSDNCRAWLALGGELPPINWQDALALVRKAAGFECLIRAKRKGRKGVNVPGEPWPHNCLRHSFVSYSLPIHGVAETARQAGNSEEKVHSNYKALVTREAALQFWAIMPEEKNPKR